MFFSRLTNSSTKSFSKSIDRLRRELNKADAVIIGAGAGLSTSAGIAMTGPAFDDNFADFRNRYGITDLYSGGFYPFDTLEEYWAWWSRSILVNRYRPGSTPLYRKLLELVHDKDYFVLTTNVDHQFQLAGFNKHRLFYTQGDYGLWQCSKACCNETYDNETQVRAMVEQQRDMKIPTELIPYCPHCGAPLTTNLRADDLFVEDEGWHAAAGRYDDFLRRHQGMHVLYLELGVGGNTPVIIKFPFWKMTAQNEDAIYACINLGEAMAPVEIADRSILIDADIAKAVDALR